MLLNTPTTQSLTHPSGRPHHRVHRRIFAVYGLVIRTVRQNTKEGFLEDIHSEAVGDYIPAIDSFSRSNPSLA
jgi:hypothetical protein